MLKDTSVGVADVGEQQTDPTLDTIGGKRRPPSGGRGDGFDFESIVNEVAESLQSDEVDIAADARSAMTRAAEGRERELIKWVTTGGEAADTELRAALTEQFVDAIEIARDDERVPAITLHQAHVQRSIQRNCRIVFLCWDWRKLFGTAPPDRAIPPAASP